MPPTIGHAGPVGYGPAGQGVGLADGGADGIRAGAAIPIT